MRRSRLIALLLPSLWLVFFANGAVLASWAPRIPDVVARLGLADAELGVALLGIALGSIPAMLLAARWVRSGDALAPCVITAVAFPLALPLVSLAGGLPSLVAVLALLGALSGGLDVSMNTLGIQLQPALGARVIGRLQGAYSLGVLAGTAGAALALRTGLPLGSHFALVSLALCAASLAASAILLATVPRVQPGGRPSPQPGGDLPAEDGASHPEARQPPQLTIPLLILAIGGFLVEGLVNDWSPLLLRRELDASPEAAATALGLFSAAMAFSRTISDGLFRGIRESSFLLMAGSALAVVTAAAFAVGGQAVATMALAVIGLCIGPLFPLALARGGRAAPEHAAETTARLSIVGYAAHLGGPPSIGFLAEHAGLPATFLVVLALTAVALLGVARGDSRPGR
jgi:MFS family permease